LQQFGSDLGMIFQIVDDILDYTSHQQEFGKKIGGDFFEGKITLPIILLVFYLLFY
jgi:octaprenyl-diphosphate synthase